jgi:hypothetical protein
MGGLGGKFRVQSDGSPQPFSAVTPTLVHEILENSKFFVCLLSNILFEYISL